MLSDMPPNSASNERGRSIAPRIAAPSMIVNNGEPLTNAAMSSATGMLPKYATAARNAARIVQPAIELGRHEARDRRPNGMSVSRPGPLGRGLAPDQVLGVDDRVEQRMK